MERQIYDKKFHNALEDHLRHLLKVVSEVGYSDWEHITEQSLKHSGHKNVQRKKGSHAPGTDVRADDGNIANKTTKYDPIRRNKRFKKKVVLCKQNAFVEISNYRTQCAIKVFPALPEIDAKVKYISSIHYDYIGLLVQQEDLIENCLRLYVYWIEAKVLKVPSAKNWEKTYGKSGNHNGYITKNADKSNIHHKITFTQSHQLWHYIKRDFFDSIANDPEDARITKLVEMEVPFNKLGCDFSYRDDLQLPHGFPYIDVFQNGSSFLWEPSIICA